MHAARQRRTAGEAFASWRATLALSRRVTAFRQRLRQRAQAAAVAQWRTASIRLRTDRQTAERIGSALSERAPTVRVHWALSIALPTQALLLKHWRTKLAHARRMRRLLAVAAAFALSRFVAPRFREWRRQFAAAHLALRAAARRTVLAQRHALARWALIARTRAQRRWQTASAVHVATHAVHSRVFRAWQRAVDVRRAAFARGLALWAAHARTHIRTAIDAWSAFGARQRMHRAHAWAADSMARRHGLRAALRYALLVQRDESVMGIHQW